MWSKHLIRIADTQTTLAEIALGERSCAVNGTDTDMVHELRIAVHRAVTDGLPTWTAGESHGERRLVLQQRRVTIGSPDFIATLISALQRRYPDMMVQCTTSSESDAVIRDRIRARLLEMRAFPALRESTNLIWSALDRMGTRTLRGVYEALSE